MQHSLILEKHLIQYGGWVYFKTSLNCFSYNNILLETVTSYCYLGIVLKYNGNFGLAIETLMDKARKAYFKIKKTVGLDNSCGLLEKCLIL